MLVTSMNKEYLWEYMTRRFCTSLRYVSCDMDSLFIMAGLMQVKNVNYQVFD